MAGGRGTRLDADVEKPLYPVGGVPMVDRVLGALAGAPVDTVRVACSPHTPETRAHVDASVVDTPGEGYVADLGVVLESVRQPTLTVAADLPLLTADALEPVLDDYEGGSLAVEVPTALKARLGVSVDATTPEGGRAPTGVNVVGDGPEDSYLCYDRRLAVNVNRSRDARIAEVLLCD